MSGLTKKTVFADRTLSTLLGVKEGELVSYAQLSKGIHKYIKDNDLKNPNWKPSTVVAEQPSPLQSEQVSTATSSATQATTLAPSKKCKDCGAEISVEAVFCDLCGVEQ
jgi:hypothetical protein